MTAAVWTDDQLNELRGMIARGISMRSASDILGRPRSTIANAAQRYQLGKFTGVSGSVPAKPADDFADQWRTKSQEQLAAHYGHSINTIRKFEQALGLKRPARVRAVRDRRKPAAKLMIVRAPLTVLRAPRDASVAGQAADYLRRYGPVARCDENGRYAENGTHYRRGSTVLTGEEVIARAERLGFDPNAWARLAA